MALNTVSSDRLSTNVKNTNFTSAEKQDLTDDIKPLLGSSGGGNKNLVINGAMQVAQRGTTSTTQNAYTTVDRWKILSGGLDEGVTTAQSDITSGLAYNDGFRKAYKVQNGNQTSGAGASDYLVPIYRFESQDLAKSAWNYVSPSSFITISFYVKSSVAQTFQVQLYNSEPAQSKQYVFEYSATTSWTRITHTVPGNSGLEIDNDVNHGLDLYFNLFHGTASTDNSYVNNQWNNYGGGNPQYKDNTSTWYTTNDATWEITGLQVEVGSVATEFDHRSFAQDLALCRRYYFGDTGSGLIGFGRVSSQSMMFSIQFPTEMRVNPSMALTVGSGALTIAEPGEANFYPSNCTITDAHTGTKSKAFYINSTTNNSVSKGDNLFLTTDYLKFDAEI